MAQRILQRIVPSAWSTFTAAMALLIAVPVLVVLGQVFVPSGDVWRHLADTVLGDYVRNSLLLMAGVGLGAALIGTGTAWLVTMCRFPGRRWFEWSLLLPLAMPAYVMAYAYADWLQFAGPVQTALRQLTGWRHGDYWFPPLQSPGGAIVVMMLVFYPYVYMLARTAFLEQSVCVLEVSRTLGCGPWRSFATVALPLARPAIAAGVALVMMETLADFGTVQYFAVNTFTTGIYRTWFAMGRPVAAAQLAAALLLFVLAVLLLERWSRGRIRFHHTTDVYRRLPELPLTGMRGALAFLACLLPLALGFLLPAGLLLHLASLQGDALLGPSFFRLAGNSLRLALTTAALAVLISLVIAYGRRLHPTPLLRGAARIAAMGYAIPGTVIAVGVLIPFAAIDNAIDAWARRTLGFSTGLLLSGTTLALVFAYLVRFLAVSSNSIEASLAKIKPSMGEVARTLGYSPGQTMLAVHLPMMRGGMFTAALLVLVDVMKELPATLIVRPFNFDTLAVRVYVLAADERLAEASTAALAIVLVGVVPVLLLSLAIARSRPGYRVAARPAAPGVPPSPAAAAPPAA
ncbi:MAG: iron ABC transporter permease [Candidatus Lambdaproteobacteria bacterium]|nr:iron ABC transporter permease [Candidatus Lambdaproteobacteria bacterium]